MCQKRSSKKCYLVLSDDKGNINTDNAKKCIRVDACLANILEVINSRGVLTYGSCCGHGKYPMTIIVEDEKGNMFDLVSNIDIPRKTRFYKKDPDGYYYIPEVVGAKNSVISKSKPISPKKRAQ